MKAIAICTAVHAKSNGNLSTQSNCSGKWKQDILNDLLAERDPSFEKTDAGERLKIVYLFAKEYLATYRVSTNI